MLCRCHGNLPVQTKDLLGLYIFHAGCTMLSRRPALRRTFINATVLTCYIILPTHDVTSIKHTIFIHSCSDMPLELSIALETPRSRRKAYPPDIPRRPFHVMLALHRTDNSASHRASLRIILRSKSHKTKIRKQQVIAKRGYIQPTPKKRHLYLSSVLTLATLLDCRLGCL